jgi:hypothetical protein
MKTQKKSYWTLIRVENIHLFIGIVFKHSNVKFMVIYVSFIFIRFSYKSHMINII